MTLAETTIDYFIALLFRDYLALPHADWMALLNRTVTSGTRALDIPDSLPRYSMDRGKDAEYPSLLMTCKEAEGNTQCRRTVNVSCILITWLKASDDGAADVAKQLTRAQSAAIQIAVENRLRDTPAFNAWLTSLPDDRKQGWNIISRLQIANAMPDRDKIDQTINFATTITLTLAVARHEF